jgi:hypothetical protein
MAPTQSLTVEVPVLCRMYEAYEYIARAFKIPVHSFTLKADPTSAPLIVPDSFLLDDVYLKLPPVSAPATSSSAAASSPAVSLPALGSLLLTPLKDAAGVMYHSPAIAQVDAKATSQSLGAPEAQSAAASQSSAAADTKDVKSSGSGGGGDAGSKPCAWHPHISKEEDNSIVLLVQPNDNDKKRIAVRLLRSEPLAGTTAFFLWFAHSLMTLFCILQRCALQPRPTRSKRCAAVTRPCGRTSHRLTTPCILCRSFLSRLDEVPVAPRFLSKH